MDRRKFLRVLALGATSLFLGDKEAAAYILDTWEPPIRKLFLRFTEYEERLSTEMIVIHHAGFPDADKDSSAEEIHKFHQEVNGWAGMKTEIISGDAFRVTRIDPQNVTVNTLITQ